MFVNDLNEAWRLKYAEKKPSQIANNSRWNASADIILNGPNEKRNFPSGKRGVGWTNTLNFDVMSFNYLLETRAIDRKYRVFQLKCGQECAEMLLPNCTTVQLFLWYLIFN